MLQDEAAGSLLNRNMINAICICAHVRSLFQFGNIYELGQWNELPILLGVGKWVGYI